MLPRLRIALALGLAVPGAVQAGSSNVDPADYAAVRAATVLRGDSFSGAELLLAPEIYAERDKARLMQLAASMTGAEAAISLSVRIRRFGWAFYDTAAANGAPLRVRPVSRNIVSCSGGGSGCLVSERIYISLTRPELDRYAETGLRFMIYGERAREYLSLPADYFAAFRDRLASVGATPGEGTADAPKLLEKPLQ
jgi:hypothetical protein